MACPDASTARRCQSNQVNRSLETKPRTRSSPVPARGWRIQAMAVRMARTNETPTAAIPTSAPFFGKRFPKSRMMTNDAVGRAGMIHAFRRNQVTSRSALHEVDVVEVDGPAVAVDEQHDRQADTDLGGGDGNDEEGEDLTGDGVVESPEGEEVD